MERGSYVSPYRSKKMSVYFKGERTRHVITHNPSTAVEKFKRLQTR